MDTQSSPKGVGNGARIDPARIIVGTMYAPFCRTEGPPAAEWPADIAKMRELGYRCLHGWCEWSRVEKAEGVYDFSEVDRLLDITSENGLACMLNLATQNSVGYHMPAWMENLYAGAGLVDSEGFGIPVRSIHAVPCLDDPWYRERAGRYIEAVARHFSGDARVAGWVVWGEPMLESPHNRPLCYCAHTVARFREWCRDKYGTIDKLNRAWSTEGPVEFASFDDVRPPVGPIGHKGGYAAWSDWCRFMPANFARNIGWADTILKRHGATQPTIAEMFCYPTGGNVSNDIWQLARSADIVGSSCFLRPGVDVELALTVGASVAEREGKSFFVVEQCGGTRGYNYDHVTPSPDEIQSEAMQAVALGAKGLMYWTWRPRFTDYEAGNFGLCRADGKPLPIAFAGGREAASLAALGRRLADAERRPQVAVLHAGGVAFSDADGVGQTLLHSEMGALRVFLDAHVTPASVSPEMIRDGLPERFRALVLPFAYALDQETCDGIKRFIERGGCVIADVNLAFKQTDGRAWRNLPGGGLDEVFGFEKEWAMFLDDESQLPKPNPYAVPTQTFLDIVTPTTAEVVEVADDRPLVLRNRFGKGEAWFFSFAAFASYQRAWGIVPLRRRVKEILAPFGVRPYVAMAGLDDRPWPGVSVAQLVREDGTQIVTFTNGQHGKWETREVVATFPGAASVAKLDGESVDVAAAGAIARFTLAPWQSAMLEVRGA